jgi:hypothetical protein
MNYGLEFIYQYAVCIHCKRIPGEDCFHFCVRLEALLRRIQTKSEIKSTDPSFNIKKNRIALEIKGTTQNKDPPPIATIKNTKLWLP